MPVQLSFIVPSRPGTDVSGITAQIRRLDLSGRTAEVFFVGGTLPPLQRNVAIRRTTGDFVFLLDDDLILPSDLVPRTLAQFDDDRVAVVGGPNTTPTDDPPFAQMSGIVLASPLATGATSSRWRHAAADRDATERKLHGCFLCFRGDLLRQYLFVEDLFPNDENELMWRLRRDGYKLYYIPECSVEHRRRSTLRSHLRQVYISGRGRGELVRRSGVADQLLYLMPLGFVFYLFALPFAIRQPILAVPFLAYLVLALGLSIVSVLRVGHPVFLCTGAVMFASHVAYAVGLLRGMSAAKTWTAGPLTSEVMALGSAPAPDAVGQRPGDDVVTAGRQVVVEHVGVARAEQGVK